MGTSSTASAYGAAGSLVIILIWIYYSAQILFLGAEFTKIYAQRYGSRLIPLSIAVPVTEEARAQQGLPSPATVAAAEIAEKLMEAPAPRCFDRHAAAVLGFLAGMIVTGLFGTRR